MTKLSCLVLIISFIGCNYNIQKRALDSSIYFSFGRYFECIAEVDTHFLQKSFANQTENIKLYELERLYCDLNKRFVLLHYEMIDTSSISRINCIDCESYTEEAHIKRSRPNFDKEFKLIFCPQNQNYSISKWDLAPDSAFNNLPIFLRKNNILIEDVDEMKRLTNWYYKDSFNYSIVLCPLSNPRYKYESVNVKDIYPSVYTFLTQTFPQYLDNSQIEFKLDRDWRWKPCQQIFNGKKMLPTFVWRVWIFDKKNIYNYQVYQLQDNPFEKGDKNYEDIKKDNGTRTITSKRLR